MTLVRLLMHIVHARRVTLLRVYDAGSIFIMSLVLPLQVSAMMISIVLLDAYCSGHYHADIISIEKDLRQLDIFATIITEKIISLISCADSHGAVHNSVTSSRTISGGTFSTSRH